MADIALSGLVFMSLLVLFLLYFLAALLVHLRAKTKNRMADVFELNSQFDDLVFNNKEYIANWLKAFLDCSPETADQIGLNIHEQQKILGSSIGFAYLGQGKAPLNTVAEKMDMFLKACLKSAPLLHEDLKLQIEQLKAENNYLKQELSTLAAAKNIRGGAAKVTKRHTSIQKITNI